VATVGTSWGQWRGWPVAWFLQLDPLVAVGTVLTTHSLLPGLVWGLVTIAVTILLGRVFCGFVCPFGALHQFVGWLARRGGLLKARMENNAYRPAQVVKYYVLIVLLAAAAGNLILNLARASREAPAIALAAAAVAVLALLWLTLRKVVTGFRHRLLASIALLAVWAGMAATLSPETTTLASLQTGLLDPIPLIYRSFNLAMLPVAFQGFERWLPAGRLYAGDGLVGVVFIAFLLLNLAIPRFFCRFVCPTGALLGVLGRGTLWSIGKTGAKCNECSLCDVDCEGACTPMGPIRISECLMCMNCLDNCPTAKPLSYLPRPSAGGEVTGHGVTRRRRPGRRAAGAPRRRHRLQLVRGSHPAARLGRGGGIPGPLPQVRRVHPRLPNQRPAAGRTRARLGGAVDPGAQRPHRHERLPAQLHCLRPRLPDGSHPPTFAGREARRGGLRGQGSGAHRPGLCRPRPLPAMGHAAALYCLRGELPGHSEGDLRQRGLRDGARWRAKGGGG
jgi:hypothetical protein